MARDGLGVRKEKARSKNDGGVGCTMGGDDICGMGGDVLSGKRKITRVRWKVQRRSIKKRMGKGGGLFNDNQLRRKEMESRFGGGGRVLPLYLRWEGGKVK